jgi:hypothetical protein
MPTPGAIPTVCLITVLAEQPTPRRPCAVTGADDRGAPNFREPGACVDRQIDHSTFA